MALRLQDDETGELVKLTPKQAAQVLVHRRVQDLLDCDWKDHLPFNSEEDFRHVECSSLGHIPTEHELTEVYKQMEIIVDRLLKATNQPKYLNSCYTANMPD